MVWLVILIVIILVITTHLVRQTGKRFREAARHEDIPAARQELAELRSLSRFLPSLRRLVQSWSVSLLLIEERYALGEMYTEGKSVTANPVLAYAWFAIAASNGQQRGLKAINTIAPKMTINQIAAGQKQAYALAAQLAASR